MPTRPTVVPVWASSSTNITTPTGGRQAQGWDIGQAPSSSNQNWWQNAMYQWQQYFDGNVQIQTPATGSNISLNLSSSDNQVLVPFTATATVQLSLPSAPDGRVFRIINASNVPIQVVGPTSINIALLAPATAGRQGKGGEMAVFIANAAYGSSSDGWLWSYQSPGHLTGSYDGSAAAAGEVGQVLTTSGVVGSASSGVIGNVSASPLILTPGAWMVSGCAAQIASAGTSTTFTSVIMNFAASTTGGAVPAIAVGTITSNQYLATSVDVFPGMTQVERMNSIPAFPVYVTTGNIVNVYGVAQITTVVSGGGTNNYQSRGYLQAVRM